MDALLIAATGLFLLVGLAWIIGRIEVNARNGAWERIAETRRDLHDKEQDLIACIARRRCPDCPINRYFTDRYGD